MEASLGHQERAQVAVAAAVVLEQALIGLVLVDEVLRIQELAAQLDRKLVPLDLALARDAVVDPRRVTSSGRR